MPSTTGPVIVGEFVVDKNVDMGFIDTELFQLRQAAFDQFVSDSLAAICLVYHDVLQVSSAPIMAAHRAADDSVLIDTEEAQARIPGQIAFCGWSGVRIAYRHSRSTAHERHDVVITVDRVRADVHCLTPMTTCEALNAALALAPSVRPRLRTLSLVMMAVMMSPLASVSVTSALTAQMLTSLTVPASWLRVDSLKPAVSVSRMIHEALTSANASPPTCRPSASVLLWVTMATTVWPSGRPMVTSSFTAPRSMAVIFP